MAAVRKAHKSVNVFVCKFFYSPFARILRVDGLWSVEQLTPQERLILAVLALQEKMSKP